MNSQASFNLGEYKRNHFIDPQKKSHSLKTSKDPEGIPYKIVQDF